MRESSFTMWSTIRTLGRAHRRGRGGGTRRWAIGALATVLLVPLLVLVPLVCGRRAGPVRCKFLYYTTGGAISENEFEQMTNWSVIKIIIDQAIWQFTSTVPPGIPVTATGAVTDPVTGVTTFSMPIAPYP